MLRTGILGVSALLVGCGGITPASGDYNLTMTLSADTCLVDEEAPIGTEEVVEVAFLFNDDGTVTIDDDDTVECTADGVLVSCQASIDNPSEQEGVDYTIVQTITVDLTWDSNTTFTGTQSSEMDCTGADCDALMEAVDFTLPCSMDYDIVGAMVEDAAGDE